MYHAIMVHTMPVVIACADRTKLIVSTDLRLKLRIRIVWICRGIFLIPFICLSFQIWRVTWVQQSLMTSVKIIINEGLEALRTKPMLMTATSCNDFNFSNKFTQCVHRVFLCISIINHGLLVHLFRHGHC